MTIEVRTKDVEEAAYLWENGFKLKDSRVEHKQHRNVVFFVLEIDAPQEVVDLAREKFKTFSSTVEPKSFSRKMQDLRDILHTKLRGYNP